MRIKTSSAGSGRRDQGFGSRGYTLLELLVVLTLIGILTATAAAALGSRSKTAGLKLAVAQVSADLRLACSMAQERRHAVALRFDVAEGRLRIDGLAERALPSGVAIALSSAGDTAVTFFPDGSSTGGIVTLTSEKQQRAIAVDWLSGRAREVE